MNLAQTNLINLVPNKHFDDVVASCVGFKFIQPVFKLCKSVALCDVVYCKRSKGENKYIMLIYKNIFKTLKEHDCH